MIFKFRRNAYSDVEIVEAYQTGDKKLQQFWYDKCRSQFGKGTSNYGGLSDLDKDDLFQDAFIILWEKMETRQLFTHNGTVHVKSKSGDNEVPDLLGYFMRVVKNKYLEMLRSGKYAVALNETVTTAADGGVIIDDFNWDEDIEVVKDGIVTRCLLSLPKSCLEILTMFYYEGKSLEQILEERPENSSYDGLKSRKSKCMTNLKKRITESFAKAGLL